jgi:anti-sigma factor RsiW
MNGREHVLDLLSAYALDALDEGEAARVSAHLAECASCRAELAGLAEAAGRLVDLNPSDPPPQLRGRVLAAVDRARAKACDSAALK